MGNLNLPDWSHDLVLTIFDPDLRLPVFERTRPLLFFDNSNS